MFFGNPAFAENESQLYAKAVKAAKTGNPDFAFMYYNAIARNYPQSKYREQILFAKGEYFFQLPQYGQAAEMFKAFLTDYPDSNGKLFALVYLFRIAEFEKNKSQLNDLKKAIVTFKQVGFIFKEFKEYKNRSPLYRPYRAVFHIDKVDF